MLNIYHPSFHLFTLILANCLKQTPPLLVLRCCMNYRHNANKHLLATQ